MIPLPTPKCRLATMSIQSTSDKASSLLSTKRLIMATLFALVCSTLFVNTSFAHETQSSPVFQANCASGYACFYPLTTSAYPRADYFGSDGSFIGDVYSDGGTSLDQSISSVSNRGTQCTVYMRDLPGFGGWSFSVSRGTSRSLTGGYDNDASSNHWCTSS
jgi:hypothetical protein